MTVLVRNPPTVVGDLYPDLVLGWAEETPSPNVLHELLNGGTGVVLQPERLRTGTLTLFYKRRDAAFAARDGHRGAGVWRLFQDDMVELQMFYVVDDRPVRVTLDEGRERWVVEVPYREVNP